MKSHGVLQGKKDRDDHRRKPRLKLPKKTPSHKICTP